MTKRKTRKRKTPTNILHQTNRMLGTTTKTLIGVTAFTVTANALKEATH